MTSSWPRPPLRRPALAGCRRASGRARRCGVLPSHAVDALVAAALKLPRPLHALRTLQLSPTAARALAATVAAPVPARWEETGRAGPRHRSEEAPREATPAEGSWGTGSCATARGDGRAGSRRRRRRLRLKASLGRRRCAEEGAPAAVGPTAEGSWGAGWPRRRCKKMLCGQSGWGK